MLLTSSSVFDPLPLQQGLRPSAPQGRSQPRAVFDPLPLQQGLRHTHEARRLPWTRLWPSSITTRIKTRSKLKHHTLYKGLWPSSITTRIKTVLQVYAQMSLHVVFDPLPLQQGLRQCICSLRYSLRCLWPSSITTRIKTLYKTIKPTSFNRLWPSSITTRIKTKPEAGTIWASESLTLFHYNKD